MWPRCEGFVWFTLSAPWIYAMPSKLTSIVSAPQHVHICLVCFWFFCFYQLGYREAGIIMLNLLSVPLPVHWPPFGGEEWRAALKSAAESWFFSVGSIVHSAEGTRSTLVDQMEKGHPSLLQKCSWSIDCVPLGVSPRVGFHVGNKNSKWHLERPGAD